MNELNKYKKKGYFNFKPTDRISQVCNAPGEGFNYGGIYIIHSIKEGQKSELVYIGISGRIDKKTGSLIARQDGIKGRIVRGKRDGEPRKNYWIRMMRSQGIDKLKISWYVVHDNDQFRDTPSQIERRLIKKYQPAWNRI